MKLSHRDFRPQKRSKYVTQPPKRRPTLRILLLAAFGILVYLKFDSFVSLDIFKLFLQSKQIFASPTETEDPANSTLKADVLGSGGLLRWSYDSSSLEFHCPQGQISDCFSRNRFPDSLALGRLRALIHKAKMAWDLDDIDGFSAHFQVKFDSLRSQKAWQVVKVDLRTQKNTHSITAQLDSSSVKFCEGKRCLDEMQTQVPFQKYSEPLKPSTHPLMLAFRPLESTLVQPILRGRIVELKLDSQLVKIYHGKTLYSTYSGLSKLNAKLEMGAEVLLSDTLGHLDLTLDSLAVLTLAIEKNGTYLDPISFLGIERIHEP